MKKITLSLCILTVLFLLTACGTNASDKAVSVAKSAIEIADKYLDNESTYSEVSEAIDDLKEDMEYVDDMPEDTADEMKQHTADFSISVDLTVLSLSIWTDNYDNTSETYDKVLEARNKLAEDAGLKKR